ncbi:MAG: histidine--tRNA ligase [Clostridiales bacterium]|nr:histidine--tRNA ligase [Clostridiales bacterium]
MKTLAVKGTKDYLPKEEELRTNIKNIIENTYKSYGYAKISTPILEDIENLKNSDGGDNLKLIFEILKRGDKFDKSIENGEYEKLSDLGLRYDLTLPLTRFYAQNKENLPKPFKSIQIDRVYRAERPQKARLREFYQCDIDVIGDDSIQSEVELIVVTLKALENLGLTDLVVKINNRKLLTEVLTSFGYKNDEISTVCVSFDKLDKISIDDIIAELNEKVDNKLANENFYKFLLNTDIDYSKFESKKEVDEIINLVKQINPNINLKFDISLVRGQSYYTGTVFEIYSEKLSGAIGGGGRYDNLIGKFTGKSEPAVGFSIGFERIYTILAEQNKEFNSKQKIAVFYNEENYIEKFKLSETLRDTYVVSLLKMPKKLGKFLDKLTEDGYYGFVNSNTNEIKVLVA